MELTSYAELAVRLVNTGDSGRDGDRLTGLDAVRALASTVPQLSARTITRYDLDALRMLRSDLREVFTAAARGDGSHAAEVLNQLLIQHPVHPKLSGHDGQPWHLHLTHSGAVADQYAAGAVMGLAVVVTHDGVGSLGVCQASSCGSVFVRTPGETPGERSGQYCSKRCANLSGAAARPAAQQDENAGAAGA